MAATLSRALLARVVRAMGPVCTCALYERRRASYRIMVYIALDSIFPELTGRARLDLLLVEAKRSPRLQVLGMKLQGQSCQLLVSVPSGIVLLETGRSFLLRLKGPHAASIDLTCYPQTLEADGLVSVPA